MDKKMLIDRARMLGPFTKETAAAYRQASERLVLAINKKMLARKDITRLVQEPYMEMMQDNHANHVRFMASLLHDYHPQVLVETVLWVFRAYRSRGFAPTYWAAQMNAWMAILEKELPENAWREVRPLYEWIQVHIPQFDLLSQPIPDTSRSSTE